MKEKDYIIRKGDSFFIRLDYLPAECNVEYSYLEIGGYRTINELTAQFIEEELMLRKILVTDDLVAYILSNIDIEKYIMENNYEFCQFLEGGDDYIELVNRLQNKASDDAQADYEAMEDAFNSRVGHR